MNPIDHYIYQNYFEPREKIKRKSIIKYRELLQKQLARKKVEEENNETNE